MKLAVMVNGDKRPPIKAGSFISALRLVANEKIKHLPENAFIVNGQMSCMHRDKHYQFRQL